MMNDKELSNISKALRKIVWQFGPKGLNGECCDDLSMPEFLALEKASNTLDCPVQDIGLSLGFTKSGATRIVNRLEKKGYIERTRSQNDGRVCYVVVTKNGKNVLTAANQCYFKRLEELLSQMPFKKAEQLIESILAMASALKK